MTSSSADRLASLNQQAIAILRLGIPLDLGLGADPIDQLREINDRLTVDAGRSESAESLLQRHSFPERYELIARMMLLADDPTAIFQSIALQDLNRQAASNPFRQAFAEPIVVLVLAYLGMIVLCSWAVPHIEAQYTQLGQTPSGVTRALILVRDAMPIWIIAAPVCAIIARLAWRHLSSSLLSQIPGARSYSRWLAAESQSRRLAVMIRSDVDQETAIALASSSVTPPTPIRPIADSIVRSGDKASRSRALNHLARFYHFLAEDRRNTYYAKTPALLGLLLSGLIVLGYGLATFLPWIEILSSLGETGGN